MQIKTAVRVIFHMMNIEKVDDTKIVGKETCLYVMVGVYLI